MDRNITSSFSSPPLFASGQNRRGRNTNLIRSLIESIRSLITTNTTTTKNNSINRLAVDPRGAWLISAGADGAAKAWSLADGRAVWTLLPGRGGAGASGGGGGGPAGATVLDCAISADGRLAATAGSDFAARVWDLNGRRLLHALEGHQGWVVGVKVGVTEGCVRGVGGLQLPPGYLFCATTHSQHAHAPKKNARRTSPTPALETQTTTSSSARHTASRRRRTTRPLESGTPTPARASASSMATRRASTRSPPRPTAASSRRAATTARRACGTPRRARASGVFMLLLRLWQRASGASTGAHMCVGALSFFAPLHAP